VELICLESSNVDVMKNQLKTFICYCCHLHIIKQYFYPYLPFLFSSNLLFLYWKSPLTTCVICVKSDDKELLFYDRVTTKLSCYFLTYCNLNCPVVSQNIVHILSYCVVTHGDSQTVLWFHDILCLNCPIVSWHVATF